MRLMPHIEKLRKILFSTTPGSVQSIENNAQSPGDGGAFQTSYNKETVNTILETVREEFEAEEERSRKIESKGQTLLTIGGLLVPAIVFLLNSSSFVLPKVSNEWSFVVIFVVFFLTLCTLWILFMVYLFTGIISVKDYRRISYEALLQELSKFEVEVQSRLISTYHEAIQHNRSITTVPTL